MSIHKNYFKKQIYETESVKETFEISKFRWNIILRHEQTLKHEFRCFIQCQHTRTILRQKNMGESLSAIFKIPKIWWNTLWNDQILERWLGVFRQYQNTKTILKMKNMGQNHLKKFSKFQKFQLILIWFGQTRVKWIAYGLTWITRKNYNKTCKCWTNLSLKKHLNYTILMKYCVLAIPRNINRFLMGIERSLPQKGIIKVYENIPIQPSQVHKVLSL